MIPPNQQTVSCSYGRRIKSLRPSVVITALQTTTEGSPMAEYHLRIKELPPSEQPRERLRDYGPAALSDAELLAILLRVGVAGTNGVQLAQQLLVERGGWPGLLRTDYADLCRQHGIGEAKAAALKAALEIGRRLLLTEHEQRFQIKSPSDVAQLLMLEMSHL